MDDGELLGFERGIFGGEGRMGLQLPLSVITMAAIDEDYGGVGRIMVVFGS